MKVKKTVMLFLSLLMVWSLFGSCPAEEKTFSHDFLEANRAYGAGEWQQAIQLYEELKDHAGLSASLCYNLGNSYVRNGQIGKAVLEYERALLLAPGDTDIRTNLERLRQARGLYQQEVPWWQKMGGLLGLNQWSLLAAVLLMGLLLLHLATLRFTFSARVLYSLTAASLLLLLLCSGGVATQYRNWQQAVIVSLDTPLLISPFDGAGSTGLIEEGCLIRIIKGHNSYALIEDGQGRRGWIPGASFESIATTMASKKNL